MTYFINQCIGCFHRERKARGVRLACFIALLAIFGARLGFAQDVETHIPDNLINGMRGIELSRRIFQNERDMIRRIRMYRPIVETYIQSLWPDTTAQVPLDDVYFLRKIDLYKYFAPEDDAYATLFGASKSSRQLLNDNGQRWEVYPDGFVYMLFVDSQDFDADTYQLTYLKSESLGEISCFVFTVSPIKKKAFGRFQGSIWVESTGLRIVKVEGTFEGVKHPGLKTRLSLFGGSMGIFFHFSCGREQIAPDLWVPVYVTIDDNMGWKAVGGDGTTDIHYKGRTVVWGYSYIGSFQDRQLPVGDAVGDPGAEVVGLEKDGLVVPFGGVERYLNSVISRVAERSHLNLPTVTCRILATTPVEMFHIDNTIIVSRGLLEMVPDESTLEVLLTHELAHIAVQTTQSKQAVLVQSLFDYGRSEEFPGLGIRYTAEEERQASALSCNILSNSASSLALSRAADFVEQLARVYRQIPNLTTARFGVGLIENGRAVHDLSSCGRTDQSMPQASSLQLRGRYTVDASTGELHPIP
jgi:hypothetical protein